jgi:hypothetical protein
VLSLKATTRNDYLTAIGKSTQLPLEREKYFDLFRSMRFVLLVDCCVSVVDCSVVVGLLVVIYREFLLYRCWNDNAYSHNQPMGQRHEKIVAVKH